MQAKFLPTLSVRRGAEAVAFYKTAFGAEEIMLMSDPDGNVVAELSISGIHFIVADEAPEYGNYSPEALGGTTIRMGLEVEDPDAFAARAIAAGMSVIAAVEDTDYGYRLGCVQDPFGHRWEIFRKL